MHTNAIHSYDKGYIYKISEFTCILIFLGGTCHSVQQTKTKQGKKPLNPHNCLLQSLLIGFMTMLG